MDICRLPCQWIFLSLESTNRNKFKMFLPLQPRERKRKKMNCTQGMQAISDFLWKNIQVENPGER